jgi:ribonuclease HI
LHQRVQTISSHAELFFAGYASSHQSVAGTEVVSALECGNAEGNRLAEVSASAATKQAASLRTLAPDDEVQLARENVENAVDEALSSLFPAEIRMCVYFDGGSRGNPGIGGAGAVVEVSLINIRRTSEAGSSVRRLTRVLKIRRYCGSRATNNEAEYTGLVCGLEGARCELQAILREAARFDTDGTVETTYLKELVVRGDSELIIKQMNGEYQCRRANLRPLHRRAIRLVGELRQGTTSKDASGRRLGVGVPRVKIEHVYRKDNAMADGKYDDLSRLEASSTFGQVAQTLFFAPFYLPLIFKGLANEAMDAKLGWYTTPDGADHKGSLPQPAQYRFII